MIRILHMVDTLGVGGLENCMANVIERLDHNRFEHVVCTFRALGPVADRLTKSGVQVLSLKGRGRKLPFQVHSRNWGAVEAVVAGRWFASCALVHSEHGLNLADTQSEPARRRWFRRVAFELADRVFSVSYQLRDLHSERTGFPARRINVIHNGVDTQRFAPNREARIRLRQEFGIAESEFCIGAVGRLDPIKDYGTLLKALDPISASGRPYRVLMLGAGPELEKLKQLAESRPKLHGHVQFLGASDRVPEILNAFDVYVLPSLSEGINNSLLEAMATGLPAVASMAGGNPEIVVHGESGMLFPAADVSALSDCLNRLSQDLDLRIRLGNNAVERIRSEFSVDAMIQKYEELYSSVSRSAA